MSSSQPLLSVVVPTYRVADYIAESMDSLARQTVTDLEVIMVDDGSPDDSAAIAADIADRDQRFRLIRQDNAGPGPARNTGIDAANGRYLAFCDPDDLVPWRAYEWLLERIERTGSSLVSGNARRFSRSGGVRQSWTHARPFAADRDATHIVEFPPLLGDRMVWNTVYRRDFWDDAGLRFPAIRYEDYPVILQAHLAATTVDVMARHVYYWRERESGDSITQQVFHYDNMLDRVVSAEMVCGIVGHARGALRRAVHAHLADVDLTAMGQAFETVRDDEADLLVALARRLCAALDPGVLRTRPRFANLQYAAIQRGDVELLRELARFRSGGGLVGGVRVGPSVVPTRVTTHYPGRRRGPWPGRLYTMPRSQLALITKTTAAHRSGDDLLVRGTAEIKHLRVGHHSQLAVELVAGVSRIPLAVRRFDDLDSHAERSLVGFEATVPGEALRRLDSVVWPLSFDVTLQVGGTRRRGRLGGVGGGSAGFQPLRPLAPGVWMHLGRGRGYAAALHRTTRPALVSRIAADGDHIVVAGLVHDRPRSIHLVVADQVATGVTTGPRRVEQVIATRITGSDEGTTSFTARVPAAALIHSAVPADPYTRESSWPLLVRTDLAERPLLWRDPADAVSVAVSDDVVVSVRRSSVAGAVRVHAGPPAVTVDRIRVDGAWLHVSGVVQPGATPTAMSWRRFLPDSDDFVEHRSEVGTGQEGDGREGDGQKGDGRDGAGVSRWHAVVDLPPLAADLESHPEPGAPLADWVLFAELRDATGPDAPAARLEPQALASVPLDWSPPRSAGAERFVSITEVRQTLHVEVR